MTCPSARKDSSSQHHSFIVYTSSVPAPLFDVFIAVLSLHMTLAVATAYHETFQLFSLRNCDFSVCSFLVMSSLFTSQCKISDKSILTFSKLELLRFFILQSLLFTSQMHGYCLKSSIKCSVAFLVHSRGFLPKLFQPSFPDTRPRLNARGHEIGSVGGVRGRAGSC